MVRLLIPAFPRTLTVSVLSLLVKIVMATLVANRRNSV
jgi:hypothetical protein